MSASTRPPLADALVSVVLPVYNEVAVLPRLHALVTTALRSCGCRHELIYVNDGSRDGSERALDELASADSAVRVLHLSRNFGHQAAVQAGLAHARGDAVIVMDSDLQDDPSCFPRLLAEWQRGEDVVYAVRCSRKEAAWKRALFFAFYRVLNRVSGTPLPKDAGNFGLMDRRVARLVAELPESDRYFSGLRGWVGFRQTGVPVERLARHDGRPRVSLRGLFRLAKTALFSFSAAPLALFYAIAGVSFIISLGLAGFALYHKLVTGLAIPGWTSGVMTASLFGALNALGIGVLGEYVVRIYDQVRGRPAYIVARDVAGAPDRGDSSLAAAIAEDAAEEAHGERVLETLGELARETRRVAPLFEDTVSAEAAPASLPAATHGVS